MRDSGDIVATVVTQIPRRFSPCREKPQRACTSSFIPCGWHDQIQFQSYGTTSTALLGPSFPVHFLRRPHHLSVQHKSRSIQRSSLLCGAFVGDIRIHHLHAYYLARQSILFTAYPTSLVPVHSVFVCYHEHTRQHPVAFLFFRKPRSHSEMDGSVRTTEGLGSFVGIP